MSDVAPRAVCSVEGCGCKVRTSGLCNAHYHKKLRWGDPNSVVRSSRETIGERTASHGHARSRSHTRTYSCWSGMVARCRNPKATAYQQYGGSGITVCERWTEFSAFLADMGECPSSRHSLDRWPNRNGNYEPGNVRWATYNEQALNRKTTRPVVRDDGLAFPSIIEAAQATGSCRRQIRDVCIGRQKTHKGHTWRYGK